MTALPASYAASKITHGYDTSTCWYKPGCRKSREQNVLSSMAQLKGEQVNAKGDQSSLRLSTRQNGRNRGEGLGGRTFSPSMPPHLSPSSPAGPFLNHLLLFSHTHALSAFAPISFLSLHVTNFMNWGWSAKYQTIYLSGEGSDCWIFQPGQPPMLHFSMNYALVQTQLF